MKIAVVVLSFLTLVLMSCTSIETATPPQPKGVSRIYQNTYPSVYNAVITAAKKKNLAVPGSANLVVSLNNPQGITLTGWGEKITVLVNALASDSTEVVVVNKPLMSSLYFPHEWQKMILDQIDVELHTSHESAGQY